MYLSSRRDFLAGTITALLTSVNNIVDKTLSETPSIASPEPKAGDGLWFQTASIINGTHRLNQIEEHLGVSNDVLADTLTEYGITRIYMLASRAKDYSQPLIDTAATLEGKVSVYPWFFLDGDYLSDAWKDPSLRFQGWHTRVQKDIHNKRLCPNDKAAQKAIAQSLTRFISDLDSNGFTPPGIVLDYEASMCYCRSCKNAYRVYEDPKNYRADAAKRLLKTIRDHLPDIKLLLCHPRLGQGGWTRVDTNLNICQLAGLVDEFLPMEYTTVAEPIRCTTLNFSRMKHKAGSTPVRPSIMFLDSVRYRPKTMGRVANERSYLRFSGAEQIDYFDASQLPAYKSIFT